MDSSSLDEAQQKDDQVFQPKEYQKTEVEIVEAEETTEETGDKTEQQTETITNMGYELYWAAESGDISVVLARKDHLQSLLTPNKNTILHIYITSSASEDQDPTEFVKEILENCPALLMQPNKKNETALHIAARYGHASIVKTLIQYAKDNHERGVEAARQMMRMRNQNQDTAFHEAVRFNHLSVVQTLVNEDCDFVYSANEEHETPLYMAVERGYRDIVFEMLDRCKSPATGGPNGRNVLHLATIHEDIEMIKEILEKMGETGAQMLEEADEMGWTPLHHAADIGYRPAVNMFLELPIGREKAAFKKDKQGNTALHLAVASNYELIMAEIIKWCPECCELVNNKGWNIFHSAVQNRFSPQSAIGTIMDKPVFSNLLNEKDGGGNTPLHHTAISPDFRWILRFAAYRRLDGMAFNKHNQNALDLASSAKPRLEIQKYYIKRRLKKAGLRWGSRMYTPINDEEDGEVKNKKDASSIRDRYDNAADANLIVATLIATVTFTAGLTVPGGFYSEKGTLQGTPLLGNKMAFKIFIIMNTIAMVCSSSAVFIHLFLRFRVEKSWFFVYFFIAFSFTTFAAAAMVAAFVTGTYAVLCYSKALSISTCVLGLPFLTFLYHLPLRRLYNVAARSISVTWAVVERVWT
nr:ankyrin repeat-containing protein At5g02620-like [Ziziphus jujuba var. spinosa]